MLSFGNGIIQDDIVYNQKDKDLVISLKDSTDQITVKYWFTSNKYRMDKIEFADGTFILGESIAPAANGDGTASESGSAPSETISIGANDGSTTQGNDANNLVVSIDTDTVLDGGTGADVPASTR